MGPCEYFFYSELLYEISRCRIKVTTASLYMTQKAAKSHEIFSMCSHVKWQYMSINSIVYNPHRISLKIKNHHDISICAQGLFHMPLNPFSPGLGVFAEILSCQLLQLILSRLADSSCKFFFLLLFPPFSPCLSNAMVGKRV